MGETESQSSSSTQSMSTGSGVAAASEAGQVNQGSAAPPAAQPQPQEQQQPAATEGPKKKKWQPLTVPSPMQIIQEDAMNNCLVKGTISCVMGGVAGLAFGLFTASIENAGVSLWASHVMYLGMCTGAGRPTPQAIRAIPRPCCILRIQSCSPDSPWSTWSTPGQPACLTAAQ
jgi:hypothetical protein